MLSILELLRACRLQDLHNTLPIGGNDHLECLKQPNAQYLDPIEMEPSLLTASDPVVPPPWSSTNFSAIRDFSMNVK